MKLSAPGAVLSIVAYRVSPVTHGVPLEPAPPERHMTARVRDARRHLARFARLYAGGAMLSVALLASADLATRPTLGPDIEDVMIERSDVIAMSTHCCFGALVFADGDDEDRYDVNAALVPEAPAPFGAEPDDESPPRRRTVPFDPGDAVIHGTIALVNARSLPLRRR